MLKKQIKSATTLAMLGLTSLLLLSSCGEVAIKRGSNANDLDTARKTCAAKNSNSKAVAQCLESHGWFIYNPETQTAEASEEMPAISKMDEISKQATHATLNTQHSEATSAEMAINKPTSSPQRTASENETTMKQQSENKPKNPLDRIKVASWWKLGGNASHFESSKNACLTELGEAHHPDEKHHHVTLGFLTCMKKHGWNTVKGIEYTKLR